MKGVYLKFLKKYVFIQKKSFILVCIITIVQSAITMCIPWIYQNLIDKAIPEKNVQLFGKMIAFMILFYASILLLNIIKDYLLAKIAEKLCLKLRIELNDKISKMDYAYFDNHSLSDILSKYNKEVDTIKDNCGYMLIKTVSNAITLILAGAMIIIMEWRILLVSVVIIVAYIANNHYWGKKIKALIEQSMECNEAAISTLSENYNNVLITKLYTAYEFVNHKFMEIYKKQYETQMNLEMAFTVNINSGGFLMQLLTGLVWMIGGLGVFSGRMTIGSVTALTNYNAMLIGPMSFFCQFNNSYQGATTAIKRLTEILEFKEEEKIGLDISNDTVEKVVFSDVAFQYNNSTEILRGVNLELKKGKTTAFIGGSGCGKSTLIKLLLRLYSPTKGNIYISDRSISHINIDSLRNKISFVPQDSHFYKGSIKENIEMGKGVDFEELIRYSKMLDLYNEILELPDQWETELNSGTSNLSGGQKKRLDVLRAFLKNTDIIIFDESTASLDMERRRKFFEVLGEIKHEKIIIFITHNIEECKYFDEVYALKSKGIYPINHSELAQAY